NTGTSFDTTAHQLTLPRVLIPPTFTPPVLSATEANAESHWEAECSLAGSWYAHFVSLNQGQAACSGYQLNRHNMLVYKFIDVDGRDDLVAMFYKDQGIGAPGSSSCPGDYYSYPQSRYPDGQMQWGCNSHDFAWLVYPNVGGSFSPNYKMWCTPVALAGVPG